MCAKENSEKSEAYDHLPRPFRSWQPKTKIGKKVKEGEITHIHEVFRQPKPIKEVEIAEILLPGLEEEIIEVKRVQRVTDSGRRMRYRVVSAVGNYNGYIGLGRAKGQEAGPTIRKSIRKAKINVREIKRGCGSWECGCRDAHSVPFKTKGKKGSVRVEITPAPRGTGLVSGDIGRKILSLAGVSDAWMHTEGSTRTNLNFAYAIVQALYQTSKFRVSNTDSQNLGIKVGMR